MLLTIVLIVHLAVCALIVSLVLLQRGKGADAGTGFGAGASGTVFGARGSANFFSRSTAVLATLFFATSLTLAYLAAQRPAPQSVLEGSVLEEPESELPALLPRQDETELPDLSEPRDGETPSPDDTGN
ncbi:MAG TPA: preprotein translocase subunit SecG [Gammaproteobacteria bacterium]